MLNQLNFILGSVSKVQLLRAVLPLTTPFSGREAQRLGGVRSTAGAQKALEELADMNVLQRITAGSVQLHAVNTDHYLYRTLAALFAEEASIPGRLAEEILGSLGDHASSVLSIMLYGSAARGDMHARSDLDLLVIVDGKSAEERVEKLFRSATTHRLRKEFGVEVSSYIVTRAAARRRYLGGDPLMKEVVANGREIVGQNARDVFEGGA